MGEPTTVCVVEDHPVLREALSIALGHHGFTVLGSANNVPDGLELIVRRRPRLAIVDLLLGGDRGDELVRRIHDAVPETRVVVFTGAERRDDLEPALVCGAHGVVSKAAAPEEFRAALRVVATGGTYLDERIRRAIAGGPPAGKPTLSAREREVLGMLANGMSLEQAASVLGLSSETVRTHARNAGRRLGGRSRVHTIALALAAGEIAL
jgi:DNA-binding NarL/FixJ family response regulator